MSWVNFVTQWIMYLPFRIVQQAIAVLRCYVIFPAYHTMLSAARNRDDLFTSAHQIKISRTTLAQCMSDSDKVLLNDDAIRQYCSRLENKICEEIGQPIMAPKS